MADEEKKDRREVIAEALEGNHEPVEFESEPSEAPEELEATEESTPEPEGGREEQPEVKAEAKEEVEAETPILPPAELPEEAKKEFEALSPELKKSFSKRFYDMRRDYTQKTTELAEQRKRYQFLDTEIEKHSSRLARKGVAPEQVVANALAWDHFVEQEGPNAALQWLEAHGYDPEELIEARDSGEAYSASRNTLPPEVQRELEESRRFRQQLLQQQQSQAVNGIYQALEEFRASKPVFKDPSTAEQIEQAMTPVVQGLRASNPNASHGELLERAYNYVVNGDERFRALVNGAEKRKSIEAQRDRAQRATRAASSVGGTGPGSGSPVSVPKDRRQLIAAAMDGRITV